VRTGPDAGPVAGSVVGPVQPAEGRPRSVVCFEAVEFLCPVALCCRAAGPTLKSA